MEVEELNRAQNNNFYRNRTLQVLEKWGIDGEMNEFNVRTAASSYARIQVKYRIMKWVTIGAIAFLAIFMGLMIGSVVLGIEATKDFKVKDQIIMKRTGNSPLKTSEAIYKSSGLRLTSPLSFVQGIKSMRFDTVTKDGQKEYLEFEVISFYYSKGRNLTLYGHNEMANVKVDGSVEIVPVSTVNGAKRYDSSLKRTGSGTVSSNDPLVDDNAVQEITTCEQFRNIAKGNYIVTVDIDCGNTYYPPIQSNFAFKLNGNLHTIKINIDAKDGEGGIFSKLKTGTIIMNVIVEGEVKGSNICGGVAARSESNVTFFTSNVFTNVVCAGSATSTRGTQVIAAGVVGVIENSDNKPVSFFRVVSQGKLKIDSPDLSNSFAGVLYGVGNGKVHRFSIVAGTFFENLANSGKRLDSSNTLNVKRTGFRSNSLINFDDLKRNAINKKDVDINDCSVDDEDGIAWFNAWLDAYIAIDEGYNTTADTLLDQQNAQMCVEYFENSQYTIEPACCYGFGVEYNYDCWLLYCQDTLAYGSFVAPCYLCRIKIPDHGKSEPDHRVGTIDGKPYTALRFEDTQRYYYKQICPN